MNKDQIEVSVQFIFSGKFYITANSQEEAEEIVRDNCGMAFGSIHTGGIDDSIDWLFDMIPEKVIIKEDGSSCTVESNLY